MHFHLLYFTIFKDCERLKQNHLSRTNEEKFLARLAAPQVLVNASILAKEFGSSATSFAFEGF